MNYFKRDIAIFIRSLQGGGAERISTILANDFVEKDYSVDLLLPRAQGPYLQQISRRVNLIDFKTPEVACSLPKVVQYLKASRPRALLSFLHYPNEIAIVAKKLAGVPTRVIVSERNCLSAAAQNSQQLSVKLTPLAAKLTYPWADGIVAISKGVASDLSQITKIKQDDIQVIYNPSISPELIEKSQQLVDHPWLQVDQPPVILAVGRLHPQKNFSTLIKAFSDVLKHKKSRLIILGKGPEEDEIRRLVGELNLQRHVDLPGFVQNPYAFMARAAVFVMSSKYEGFGNVLVEAMSTKTEVISTNCKSGPSEILDGGKYGQLVPVGNADAMARAILEVLSGKRHHVPDSWLRQFTPEICSQKYLNVLGFGR